MLTSSLAALLTTLLAISGSASALPEPVANSRRQIVKPISGFIIQPTDGSSISAGSTFPFQYDVDNYCEQGYTPVTIWIVPGPDAPTPASLNATQGFSDGTYLAYLGHYLVANFGCKFLRICDFGSNSPMNSTKHVARPASICIHDADFGPVCRRHYCLSNRRSGRAGLLREFPDAK